MTDLPEETALTSFERHRTYLRGLAYRMTGSLADAEDVVQEAYLRWRRTEAGEVRDARAFLATLVTRLCLDQLKSARARRESYVGPWLPEPVIDADAVTVEAATELAQDVSVALLLALERLSPLERAAFLLHDVFGYEHAELAEMLGKSAPACRKLCERARTHVRSTRVRQQPTDAECQRLVSAFQVAVASGSPDALGELLLEDAVLYADGGGRAKAALKPIIGRDKVTKFLLGVTRKVGAWRFGIEPARINGMPGLLLFEEGVLVQTVAFELHGNKVYRIYSVRNPDKLPRTARLSS